MLPLLLQTVSSCGGMNRGSEEIRVGEAQVGSHTQAGDYDFVGTRNTIDLRLSTRLSLSRSFVYIQCGPT